MTQGRENVVFYESGDRKKYLGYCALFNTFTPLILKEGDGIGLWPLGGDNTALVMTFEGSLYAFNPYGEPESINDETSSEKLPYLFKLSQNYPNPFNPTTVISWQLAVGSHVDLSIYNILGQKVVTLVSGKQKAGSHSVEWNAMGFASGIYFYRLKSDAGFFQSKKLLLLK